MDSKKIFVWWDCYAIIIGIMIGTGIFKAFPSLIAAKVPSVTGIVIVWILGGLVSWCGALCYIELTSLFPHSGGEYTYLSKMYSSRGETLVSFLFAWTKIFVIRPSSIAILALIFGDELKYLLNLQTHSNMLTLGFALGLIFILTIINISSVHVSKYYQNIITWLKIGILIFIILIGIFIHKPESYQVAFTTITPESKGTFDFFFRYFHALILCMWVFGGWNEAVYMVEETKNPLKDIPKALFIGIFSITILYLGINLIYIKFLSAEGLASTYSPASNIMEIWFGTHGKFIMSIIIIISSIGAANGLIITGGRISQAVAADFSKLDFFAIIHKKYKTPAMAFIANFIITSFLLILSRGKLSFIENLTCYTSGVFWYFFGLVVMGLIILRFYIDKDKILFKGFFYSFIPILFFIITCGMIWGAYDYKPIETLLGIFVLNLGIPLYYFLRIDDRRKVIRYN